MLLQEHSSCLCRGENGKPFCPAELIDLHWSFGFIEISPLTPSTRSKIQKTIILVLHTRSFPLLGRTNILLVNYDSWGQVGGFQNRGVCLQAFPSFLPHPLPALLLAPFFPRSLTLVPRSLLLSWRNRYKCLTALDVTSCTCSFYF